MVPAVKVVGKQPKAKNCHLISLLSLVSKDV